MRPLFGSICANIPNTTNNSAYALCIQQNQGVISKGPVGADQSEQSGPFSRCPPGFFLFLKKTNVEWIKIFK